MRMAVQKVGKESFRRLRTQSEWEALVGCQLISDHDTRFSMVTFRTMQWGTLTAGDLTSEIRRMECLERYISLEPRFRKAKRCGCRGMVRFVRADEN